jgi:hypothetical protein
VASVRGRTTVSRGADPGGAAVGRGTDHGVKDEPLAPATITYACPSAKGSGSL